MQINIITPCSSHTFDKAIGGLGAGRNMLMVKRDACRERQARWRMSDRRTMAQLRPTVASYMVGLRTTRC